MPPSDEGGAPKGRRERNALQNHTFLSPSQPVRLTAPSSEGAFGAVQLLDKFTGQKPVPYGFIDNEITAAVIPSELANRGLFALNLPMQ